jgi:alpha-tubulin suppressor-like RCC1 family protein
MWGDNSQGTLGKSFAGVSSISSPIQVDSSQWSRLSVGTLHTLAIKSNGTLWAWGGNLYGQCGFDTAAGQYKSSRVSIGTGWQTVDVSLGGAWALGIKTDGTLWAWGNNAAGALGTSSLTSTSSPVLVSGPAGASWSAISAGTSHALAITTLGRLYAWGSNVSGRLGDLSIVTKSSPVLVSGPAATSWLAVSAGGAHSMAITTGQVGYAWGNGANGQLGSGSTVFNWSSPLLVGVSPTTSVAAGDTHSLLLFQGRPYATGSASAGQLGNSSLLQVSGWVVVSGPAATSWASVSAGTSYSAGITTAGRLYAWGLNTSGQVGISSLTSVSSPVLVSGPAATSWSFVRIKNQTSLAITTVGALYAWGNNTLGNLGVGTLGTYSSPVAVQSPASGSWTVASASLSFGQFVDSQNNFYFAGDGLTYFYPTTVASIPQQVGTSSWTAVSAGDGFSLGITTEGRLFAWGYNLNGEGGRLTTTNVSTPTLVSGPAATSWSAISAGGGFSIAVTSLGALYTWGTGGQGRLGDGTVTSKSSPVKIGSSSWTAVGAGAAAGYGLNAAGRLFAWGRNAEGQLGIATLVTTSTSSPVLVSGPASTSWALIAAGGTHVLAATVNFILYAWGLGTSGQLGTNAALTVSSPVLVASPARPLSWKQIATGFRHAVAIRSDNTLWAWGNNTNGQLGDSTLVSKSTPIQIGSGSWNSVAAGAIYSSAIRSDGTLWAWGANTFGQLGDLSTITKSSPVLVSGPAGASWQAIANGGAHTLGITTTGRLYAWGLGTSGQLGNNAALSVSSPVLVSGPAATSWALISSGGFFSLAVNTTGRLYAWGRNIDAELGDLTTVAKSTPILVSGPANTSWSAIAGGFWHSLAISTTGVLYAWGYNASGQLGDLSLTTKSSPVLVSGPAATSWSVVSTLGNESSPFQEQSYAITTTGRLYAWGSNNVGQLGDLTTISKSSPILVSGPAATSWSFLASGGTGNTTIIAITTAGLGYGWGFNTLGQAGIGSVVNVSSPVVIQAPEITSWLVIGAGLSHSVGVTSTGRLYAWGNNANGQLGDLTTTNRSSPVLVSGPTATSWANLGTGYAGNFAGAITGTVVIPPIPTPPPPGTDFALFGGGFTSAVTAVTDKYTYSGDIVAAGTALGTARYYLAAAGNSTRGIFGGGYIGTAIVAVTDKYTYSGDTCVAGTSLGIGRSALAAAGNSTQGIFGGGFTGGTLTAMTDKYTYSSDTRVAGTALGTARDSLAAAGNSTQGIFGGGYISTVTAVTDKYTYSTDAVAGGTVLGTARYGLAAAGNSTLGIFGGGIAAGPVATTDKYTYSGDTRVAGTALGTARNYLAAAGNGTVGIFGGGSGSSGNTTATDKYEYSGDAVASGTALGTARAGLAATSQSPGGF